MATTPELGIKITGDSAQLQKELDAASKATADFAGKTRSNFDREAKAMADSAAKMARQNVWQTFQLYQQLQDVGLQIAGGQNPLLALAQQGSQLTAIYGSFGAALAATGRAVAGFITNPVGLAAAAVAGLGYAFYRGDQQSADFRRSLLLTGNAAGLTKDSFDSLLYSVAFATDKGTGHVRDFAQALVSTGRFGGQGLAQITALSINMASVTKASIDATVQSMVQMQDAPARWAAEQNKQLNFMTYAQLQYVTSLEATGQREKAAQVVREALMDRFPNNVAKNFGIVENLLEGAKQKWSSFWDIVYDVGREPSESKTLRQVKDQIELLNEQRSRLVSMGANTSGIDRAIASRQADLDALEQKNKEATDAANQAQADAAKQRNLAEQDALEKRLRPLRDALTLTQSDAVARMAIRDIELQRSDLSRKLAETEQPLLQIYYQQQIAQQDMLDLAVQRQKLVDSLRVNELKPIRAESPIEDTLQKQQQRINLQQQIADIDAQTKERALRLQTELFARQQQLTSQEAARRDLAMDTVGRMREQAAAITEMVNQQEFNNSLLNKAPDLVLRMTNLRDAQLLETRELLKVQQQLDQGIITEGQAIEQSMVVQSSAARLRNAQLVQERAQLDSIYNAQKGVTDAVRDYGETVRQQGRAAYDATRSVIGALEDDLISTFKTGELNAKRFVDTLISEFLRLKVVRPIIQSTLAGGGADFLSTIFGGRNTNTGLASDTSRSMDVNTSFAGGGWTGSGARIGGLDGQGGFLAMMHPQESVFDHALGTGVLPKAGGNVTVNIINQSGADVQTNETTGPDGAKVIDVIVTAVTNRISSNLFNRTGDITRAVKSVFA